MNNISKEKLKIILDNHQHWIRKDTDGWENMRADLRGVNLYGADLSGVNLYGANLRGTDLSGANLSGANLRGVNLYGANLRGTDLSGANLYGANLYRADLSGVNLYGANLSGVNLYGANLRGTDLSGANLYGANLRGVNLYGANLRGTDLYGTDLYGTDLRGAKNIPYVPMNCPDSGSFIGWKKAVKYKIAEVIVKIQITEDAKRSSATGRKCRCSKAIVLEFQDIEGNIIDIPNVRSHYDHDFIYRVGEIIEVNDFDDNRWNECASGVHFFINRQDAVDYKF